MLPKGGVILGPVRNPAPLPGNVMSTISVVFERHDWVLVAAPGAPSHLIYPPVPTRRSMQQAPDARQLSPRQACAADEPRPPERGGRERVLLWPVPGRLWRLCEAVRPILLGSRFRRR